MKRATKLAAWLGAAMFAMAPLYASPGAAQRLSVTSVAVGELGTTTGAATSTGALRDALTHELDRLAGVRLTPTRRARYVVRGSVVRLETEASEQGHRVQCEVSLIVAERRGGTVRMMLSGRAAAEGPRGADRLRETALAAAVRGALRPLGRTLVAMR